MWILFLSEVIVAIKSLFTRQAQSKLFMQYLCVLLTTALYTLVLGGKTMLITHQCS